jgi:hypothetical protein
MMNGHEILKFAGGALALAVYLPMVLEIVRSRGAGQSFATWGLWALMDSTLTVTLWQQHGNYLLPLGFSVGGVVLAVVLLAQGHWSWSWFETVIALMVLAGMVVWQFSGPRNATIAMTVAVCLAGVPGFVAMLRHPQPAAGKIWAGFTAANLLAFFGGTAMTVEERLVPAAFTGLCALMAGACWWPAWKQCGK